MNPPSPGMLASALRRLTRWTQRAREFLAAVTATAAAWIGLVEQIQDFFEWLKRIFENTHSRRHDRQQTHAFSFTLSQPPWSAGDGRCSPHKRLRSGTHHRDNAGAG